MFVPLLEKLSATSKKKTIIVVDNIDLVKVSLGKAVCLLHVCLMCLCRNMTFTSVG